MQILGHLAVHVPQQCPSWCPEHDQPKASIEDVLEADDLVLASLETIFSQQVTGE